MLSNEFVVRSQTVSGYANNLRVGSKKIPMLGRKINGFRSTAGRVVLRVKKDYPLMA
jgi:hypothetical protein